MAATWAITITPITLTEKRVSILAVRTDEELLTTNSFQINTIIATAEQKIAAMDMIWELWQEKLSLNEQITTLIGTLETQAKINLEARE